MLLQFLLIDNVFSHSPFNYLFISYMQLEINNYHIHIIFKFEAFYYLKF